MSGSNIGNNLGEETKKRVFKFSIDRYGLSIDESLKTLGEQRMWGKYDKRLVECGLPQLPRQQTLLEHSLSCAYLAENVLTTVGRSSIISHDASLVSAAAVLHKVGAAKLASQAAEQGKVYTERAWRDMVPADRVNEYRAFQLTNGKLPAEAVERRQKAFLLQLARFPGSDYSEDPELCGSIQSIREYHMTAVRLFEFIEMFNYLGFAHEQHRNHHNVHVLTWVFRNIVGELNRIASGIVPVRENFWTAADRDMARDWLHEYRWVPSENLGEPITVNSEVAA